MAWEKDCASDFKDAFAAFKNTRKESRYFPNQLFYLRNWRETKLPNILAEPSMEEMVKARDRVRVGKKVKKYKDMRGWPTR